MNFGDYYIPTSKLRDMKTLITLRDKLPDNVSLEDVIVEYISNNEYYKSNHTPTPTPYGMSANINAIIKTLRDVDRQEEVEIEWA